MASFKKIAKEKILDYRERKRDECQDHARHIPFGKTIPVAEKYLLLMGSFHKMRSQFPTH
jgi:hypothetical protein